MVEQKSLCPPGKVMTVPCEYNLDGSIHRCELVENKWPIEERLKQLDEKLDKVLELLDPGTLEVHHYSKGITCNIPGQDIPDFDQLTPESSGYDDTEEEK
jgi:hypothetical protein